MKKRLILLVSGFLIVGLTFGMSYMQRASATPPGPNQLASADASGAAANGQSQLTQHSVSGDGRYVVFRSNATNLIASDANGANYDVFVKDTQTGAVTLVNVSDTGVQASSGGWSPAISYDGRYVVFISSNALVSGVTGANIYRRDLVNNTTSVVSVDSSGVAHSGDTPDINADGRYITYTRQRTSPPIQSYVVIKDMVSGTLRTVAGDGPAPGGTMYPSIDCSGRVVTFISNASLSSDTPANYNYVYYIYNYYVATIDWSTTTLKWVDSGSTFSVHRPQVSCNGNVVVYPHPSGYSSNRYVIYKYNRLTDAKASVSVNSSGQEANLSTISYTVGSVSDDGRYVTFATKGTNMDSAYGSTYKGSNYDVYVRDTKAGVTSLISHTALGYQSGLVPVVNGVQEGVSLSPDGSTVAYAYATPDATNTNGELITGLHTGQQDIYVSKTGF